MELNIIRFYTQCILFDPINDIFPNIINNTF